MEGVICPPLSGLFIAANNFSPPLLLPLLLLSQLLISVPQLRGVSIIAGALDGDKAEFWSSSCCVDSVSFVCA